MIKIVPMAMSVGGSAMARRGIMVGMVKKALSSYMRGGTAMA